ncbi:MAG TPA: tRNA (adenosine(37)-N6)-dimethylallyltransferase MiaA [Bacillota bacterium]|nr:tRNA (adenosine(37)-N6)-dimethylallyltransferase MiaA [Bacillota bacterium]
MLPNLIIIVGPTAVGKTAVGIQLAKLINGEVISGDSMQVYRMMDIGTAKPTREEMEGVPHHMLDVVDPDEDFTVAVFKTMVEQHIQAINVRGKMPILVGGTGLYIRSITDQMTYTSFAVDWEYRDKLMSLAREKGNEWLHSQLVEVDPVSAQRIHANDVRRIIRALEVFHFTGKTISKHQQEDQEANGEPKYNLHMYGLTINREKLYKRINLRVEKMIANGLVEEVKGLLAKGYDTDLVAMGGLGYKEIVGYLQGKYSLPEAVALLQRNTRRFAKRQLTWFRGEKRITWLDMDNYQDAGGVAKEILQQVAGQLTTM